MEQNNETTPGSPLRLCLTADGSHTLYSDLIQEHFHSTFGALQESRHIFIRSGLLEAYRRKVAKQELSDTSPDLLLPLKVFELGLGTGLNALLTIMEAQSLHLDLDYECIEAYPLTHNISQNLNYPGLFPEINQKQAASVFSFIHQAAWNKPQRNEIWHMTLLKHQGDFVAFEPKQTYDLVYWDAFSPDKQAELWQEALFARIYQAMNTEGVLVSYCAKGEIRRRLMSVGFKVERLEGPPGKREIIRAIKE